MQATSRQNTRRPLGEIDGNVQAGPSRPPKQQRTRPIDSSSFPSRAPGFTIPVSARVRDTSASIYHREDHPDGTLLSYESPLSSPNPSSAEEDSDIDFEPTPLVRRRHGQPVGAGTNTILNDAPKILPPRGRPTTRLRLPSAPPPPPAP